MDETIKKNRGSDIKMDIENVIEEKYTNYLNCETEDIDLTIEEAKFILANDEKEHFVDDILVEAYKVVLSELERLKKYENLEWQEFNELAVKDKIIEEMAKTINKEYYKDIIENYTKKVEGK